MTHQPEPESSTMATDNFRTLALSDLGFTIADLRNPDSRAMVLARAEELKAEAKASNSNRLTQRKIAMRLDTFPGFSRNPEVYGPTTAEIANSFREDELDVKNNTIANHLYKMMNSGVIDNCPKLETNGMKGAPPVFWFCVDEKRFNQILNGELVVTGE